MYNITSAKYRLRTPRNHNATIRNRHPGPSVPYKRRVRELYPPPNRHNTCHRRRNRICPRWPDCGQWPFPWPPCRCCPPLGWPVASHSNHTFQTAQSRPPVTLGRTSSYSAHVFLGYLFSLFFRAFSLVIISSAFSESQMTRYWLGHALTRDQLYERRDANLDDVETLAPTIGSTEATVTAVSAAPRSFNGTVDKLKISSQRDIRRWNRNFFRS